MRRSAIVAWILLTVLACSAFQQGSGLPAMGSTWKGAASIAAPVFIQGVLVDGAGAPQVAAMSPTAGNGVIIGFYHCADAGACTANPVSTSVAIKDNINNPETCFVASPASPITVADSGGFHEVWNWYICPSIPAGVTSITLTESGSNFLAAWVMEASGVPASTPVDSEGHGQSATTAVTGSAVTASNTNSTDLCFAMVDNDIDQKQSFVLTAAANASAGSTVYTGTITGGGSNSLSGITYNVTGFSNGVNNGRFADTASSTTTMTLSNASGVAETHAGRANSFGSGWIYHFDDGSAGNGALQTLTTSSTGAQTGQASWAAADTWFAEALCLK